MSVPLSPSDEGPPDTLGAMWAHAPVAPGPGTEPALHKGARVGASSLAAALHSAAALSAGGTRTQPADLWATAANAKVSPAGSLSDALQQAAVMASAPPPPPPSSKSHNWAMSPSPSAILPSLTLSNGRAQSASHAARNPLQARNTLVGANNRPTTTKGRWGAVKQATLNHSGANWS